MRVGEPLARDRGACMRVGWGELLCGGGARVWPLAAAPIESYPLRQSLGCGHATAVGEDSRLKRVKTVSLQSFEPAHCCERM